MDELFNIEPFSLKKKEKEEISLPIYSDLTCYHYRNCEAYRRILDCVADKQKHNYGRLEDIPFLPVRIFKEYDLYSVPKEEIVRTVTSSGTTGQVSSRIFLDRYTASCQQKALARIVGSFIGKSRMPMLVLDCPDVVKDRTKFSTRGAGILGFSVFGTRKAYALNNDMTINYQAIKEIFENAEDSKVFLFGFTYIIWKHFLLEIEKNNNKFDMSKAVMIHGGGWKKLKSESVSREEFRERFKNACGIKAIYENYGMAEQTGSIFMECEQGHLHASNFSQVIMRNPMTLLPCNIGEKGVMQVMSVLPRSYSGHSLLTEDEGIILGEDDCPCGRKGKYFEIIGRLHKAELRGCSDTYAAGISK